MNYDKNSDNNYTILFNVLTFGMKLSGLRKLRMKFLYVYLPLLESLQPTVLEFDSCCYHSPNVKVEFQYNVNGPMHYPNTKGTCACWECNELSRDNWFMN